MSSVDKDLQDYRKIRKVHHNVLKNLLIYLTRFERKHFGQVPELTFFCPFLL